MCTHPAGSTLADRKGSGPPKSRRRLSRRHGGATLFLLLGLGFFLSLLALAVEGANLWSARQEAQTCADAAALAGVQALADDLLLTPNPEAGLVLRERAAKAAQRVAELNPICGLPFDLQVHPYDPAAGDLRFGHATPLGFQPADAFADVPDAVAVGVERSHARGQPIPVLLGRFSRLHGAEVRTAAWASLDRAIVGFRPTAATPVPLVPLALFSDPTRQHPASFEVQAETSGTDAWVFDRARGQVVPLPSEPMGGWELAGIREVTVRVPLGAPASVGAEAAEMPNGRLLRLGPNAGHLDQWRRGLGPADLDAFGGAMVVPANGSLAVPALPLPASSSTFPADLLAVLEELRAAGSPRVWPLFQADSQTAAADGEQVLVSGFIAARLARVSVVAAPYPHLELILEPCQMPVNLAVADPGRPGLEPNRYISKPRLR